MALSHLAKGTGTNDLQDAAVIPFGVDLGTHLRRQLLLGRHAGRDSSLVDRVRQRLLAVDMFAPPHRAHARWSVNMVGRADDDRVDLTIQFVE